MSAAEQLATWVVVFVLLWFACEALYGMKKAGAALERIAKVAEDAQANRCRCCDDDDGPEGEELEIPPDCVTDIPPPPAAKVKVLN